ncbi:MAG: SEC-C domain-containing protein [Oscillospiraceae bacterium]|nr:SEC-C domain-containing protein [Oscillospiraceae bacterium]
MEEEKVKPVKPIVTLAKKVGRNERCPCGSRRKFKKCCFFTESTSISTLPRDERLAFFSLWYPLLEYVNRILRLGLDIDLENELPKIEVVMILRERLWEDPSLISRFIRDTGGKYVITPEGVQIFKSWENQHVKGTFFVVKYTPEYAVLMPIESEKNPVFYGVRGLESTIAEVLNYKVHTIIDTVLLPYDGKIVYDGLIAPYPLVISNDITDQISKKYEEAVRGSRIITSFKYPHLF